MLELTNEISITIIKTLAQPHTQSGPRIAALEAKGTAEPAAVQFNHQEAARVNSFFASSFQDEKTNRGYK